MGSYDLTALYKSIIIIIILLKSLASFCLSALIRSQFLLDFDGNFAQKLGARKVRMLSLGGQKSDDPGPLPYFAPFSPP